MATIKYTGTKGISSTFDNGSSSSGLYYSAAYITPKNGSTQLSDGEWPNTRRFFGSDSGRYAYVYSAALKMPVGKNFQMSLTITGNNGIAGTNTGNRNMLFGYTDIKPTKGSEPTLGTKNSPSGLSGVKGFVMPSGYQGANLSSTITFTLPDAYSGKTVYFFFWGKNGSSDWSAYTFMKLEGQLDYIEYTNVGDSSIASVDKSILKYNGSFTITINPGTAGTNNPVAGYRIYYSTGTVTTNSNYKYRVPENNRITLSYSDIGSPARGSTVKFGIMTIGNISGYNSGLNVSSLTIKINSLPTQPVVTMKESIVPKNGTKYDVIINSISSTDADSDTQTLTYKYALTASTSLTDATWLNVPSNKTISCDKSTMYLSFKAYDGLEYSKTITKTLTENTGPINCAVNSITGSGYEGALGYTYTRKLTLKATGSSDYTYEWFYKYQSGSYISLGQGKELANKTIEQGLGTIDYKLVITDKYTDQTIIQGKTSLSYATNLTSDDIQVTLYNLSNCESLEEVLEFSRNMSTKILFSKNLGKLFVKKIRLKILSKEDSSSLVNEILDSGENFNSISGNVEKIYNLNIDKISTANLGECKLQLIFYASNQNGSDLKIYTYEQTINLIPFFNNVFSSESWAYLYLNDNSQIENIVVNAGPEDIYQVKDMAVYIESPITKQRYNISDCTTFIRGASDAASKLIFSQPQKIFSKVKIPSNKNYVLKSYVFPINIFDESIVNSSSINGYEIPASNTLNVDFKVLYNSLFVAPEDSPSPYILPHISYSGTRNEENRPDWSSLEISEKQRMINYGEYLYLDNHYLMEPQITIGFDEQGNKFERTNIPYRYTLQYSKLDANNSPTTWENIGDWENFSVAGNVLPFSINNLNGERIIFRLGAKDEYNLPVLSPSGEEWLVVNSANYLIGCRREQPNIIISECVARNGSYYAILKIDDYGGNNKGYDNFARNIDEVSLNEKAEGSYKITWRCGEKSDSLVLIDEYKNGRIANLSQNKGELPHNSIELNLGKLNELTGRIYIQIEITFYYNINGDYINTKTPVFIIYTEGPTVSYRYHQLGINTNIDSADNNDNKIYGDDVLTISDFQDKKYVRLKGDYIDGDTTITREILIDLKNGTVTGLTINCGTW